MTRPIYEPTLQRTDARLNYGQSQLFRRPAPTAGGGVPWVRMKQLLIEQHWDADDQATIIYDDVCNFYPDVFEVVSDPDPYAVHFLVPGLYQATCRVYPALPFPVDGFEIVFYNVDWDEWAPYSTPIHSADTIPRNTSLNGYAEVMFRAGPTNAANGDWNFYADILTSAADALDLYAGGTYLEVRKIGDDPYWPDGLDNANFECMS